MPKKILENTELCRRFADIREVSKLNKRQFAKLLGIDITVAGDIELGYREPSKEVMLKMASACQANIHWLLTGEGEMFLSKEKPAHFERPEKHPLIQNIEAIVSNSVKDHVAELERGIMAHLADLEAKLGKPQGSEPAAKPTFEYPTESRSHESYTFEPEPDYTTIPYGEDVAAGPPIQHPDFPYLVVKVPSRYVKTKPWDYFAFHVKGNSMMDANIPDGCMVMIHRSDIPVHNRIQVVEIDEGITIKRMVENEDHGWTLRHEDGTEQTVPLGEVNQVLGDFVVVLPPATRPFELNEGQDSSEGD